MKLKSFTLLLMIGMVTVITAGCNKTETEKGFRGIEFRKQPIEFTKAIHLAWKEEKMILLHITPPNDINANQIYDKKILDYTNDHFVSYELPYNDSESENWLNDFDITLDKYGITFIINPHGQEIVDIISDKSSNETFLRRLMQIIDPENSIKSIIKKKEIDGIANQNELAQLLKMMHEDDDDCYFVGIKYLAMKEVLDLNNEADVIAIAHGTDRLNDENVLFFIKHFETIHNNFPELFEYKMIRLLDRVRGNAISYGDRNRLKEEVHLIYPGYLLVAGNEAHSEEQVYDLLEAQILTK